MKVLASFTWQLNPSDVYVLENNEPERRDNGVLQATPMSEEEHLSKKLRLEKRAEGLAMLQ